jgi:hypothetical protein
VGRVANLLAMCARLEVVDADDQRSIFLNGHLAGRYPCDDKGTERGTSGAKSKRTGAAADMNKDNR